MDRYDKYRKRAAEAQAKADQCRNQDDKASWLRIAESYLAMLPEAKQSAEQRFDARAQALGTCQDDSGSSH